VLLIMLWVRSYTRIDYVYCQLFNSPTCGVFSGLRCLSFVMEQPGSSGSAFDTGSHSLKDSPLLARELESETSVYGLRSFPGGRALVVPHYFVALLMALLAGLAWFHWHFTLRTLLIVTTLVAVGLGLIVWLR